MSIADAARQVEPLLLSIPAVAHEFFFACGCLDSHCVRSGFQAEALPYVAAAELRGMAGELIARADMNPRMSALSAAHVLLARAESLEKM
jgi:hypothetical protein